MMKKICFSLIVVLMIAILVIGFIQYNSNLLPISEQINEKNPVPFYFANFRSFDLIVVIMIIFTSLAGMSSIFFVKKEGDDNASE
ncbi:MAG: hypothetical protein FWC47_12710 [Oscillospiraceae bacterium]|nr:hypothetical protein [Oscillospiraceae bacterium]